MNIELKGSGSTKVEKLIYESVLDLESKLSYSTEGSDIDKINKAGAGESVSVSKDTIELLLLCKELHQNTDGAFNPAISPVVKLWGFAAGDFLSSMVQKEAPSDEEISSALALCSFDDQHFLVDSASNTVTKKLAGAQLDLGAVGKGYAAEKAYDIARTKDKVSGFVNVGGNIYVVGKEIPVGIANPRASDAAYFGKISLKNTSITTSGDYERFFLNSAGDRFCHILDGRTGKQAENGGIVSVSVIGKNGALADALSTSIFILGEEKGRELLSLDVYKEYSAIIIFNDKTYSCIRADGFQLSDAGYSVRQP